MQVPSLGREDPLEDEMATYSGCSFGRDTYSDCSTRKGVISGNTYLLNLLRKGVGYEAKPLDTLSSVLTSLSGLFGVGF